MQALTRHRTLDSPDVVSMQKSPSSPEPPQAESREATRTWMQRQVDTIAGSVVRRVCDPNQPTPTWLKWSSAAKPGRGSQASNRFGVAHAYLGLQVEASRRCWGFREIHVIAAATHRIITRGCREFGRMCGSDNALKRESLIAGT